MVIERDLTWGSEHTIQCTDDVLWNCAPETCIILLTSVTPTHSIKRKLKAVEPDETTQRVVPRTEHTRGSEDVAAIEPNHLSSQ